MYEASLDRTVSFDLKNPGSPLSDELVARAVCLRDWAFSVDSDHRYLDTVASHLQLCPRFSTNYSVLWRLVAGATICQRMENGLLISWGFQVQLFSRVNTVGH